MKIFDDKIPLLTQAIKYSTMRHDILSNNVANIDTPNYVSKDLSFKKELNASMQKASSLEPLAAQPKYTLNAKIVDNEIKFKEYKNTVDLDIEMSKISKNTILHNTLVQVLNQKFKIIKSVLNS
ncbi:MAG: flagellar basal body rod protein FlgB [Candidatus Firestonebacteria bacterium]|nr:flagellar basal body rod protein FlgB [Candidatus Firestonebacteria bacterium]